MYIPLHSRLRAVACSLLFNLVKHNGSWHLTKIRKDAICYSGNFYFHISTVPTNGCFRAKKFSECNQWKMKPQAFSFCHILKEKVLFFARKGWCMHGLWKKVLYRLMSKVVCSILEVYCTKHHVLCFLFFWCDDKVACICSSYSEY